MEYNEAWVLSRTDSFIRGKLEELFAYLSRNLPSACSYRYSHPLMLIRYRGERCAFLHIQRRQIRLHIAYRRWVSGLPIGPKTDLGSTEFRDAVRTRFHRVFARIDRELGDGPASPGKEKPDDADKQQVSSVRRE